MLVVKRDGRRESVRFDKITARVEKLCYGLDTRYVEPIEVAKKVIAGIYDGVTTVELDNLAAEVAASMTTKHPDYAVLAARIAISSLHKETSKSFSNTMKRLYTYIDTKTGKNASLISKEAYEAVRKMLPYLIPLLFMIAISAMIILDLKRLSVHTYCE
jgi:ribonucleoside-diphosphate reductase alpha chain